MANSTIELVKENIKKYRIEAKLTQEQLSELAGISCDYLSELERGKRVPSLKRLILIAEALKIEPYKFLK
ncbi:helix-turn-helix transcriptional regulator [bacterium]|nr:helix-turn-helix transcriptional regulator [bacterium]